MNEKHEDNLDRVWDIIEKVGVTMLTTQFSGGLRARPLEARPERDAGLIWFVTDVRSGKEHEIEAEHDVCLVFIDAGTKAYLSITARAEVRHDHAKAAEIWKSTDNMWWSGPDDPNVCVLRVRPVTAELWDGPAYAAVAAFEFAKAGLGVRGSYRPAVGRRKGLRLRRRRHALPFLQRIQRRQPAAASGGLSTRRESRRRLSYYRSARVDAA